MKVKEESEKVGLKLNIQKIKFMASSPITSSQIEGRKVEVLTDLMFLGSKIISDSDCSHEIKRRLLLGKKTMTNLDSIFKSKTLLCKQRSTQSKLWFFQWCMDVRVGPWRRLSAKELMFLNCLKQLKKTLKLEKTLQNPLNCREIKPANFPKGNQFWIFTGKAVAEAEAPILRPLDWKRRWCWERLKQNDKGATEDGWHNQKRLDGITDSMDMNFSKIWETVKDRKAWQAVFHRVAKSQTWLNNNFLSSLFI